MINLGRLTEEQLAAKKRGEKKDWKKVSNNLYREGKITKQERDSNIKQMNKIIDKQKPVSPAFKLAGGGLALGGLGLLSYKLLSKGR